MSRARFWSHRSHGSRRPAASREWSRASVDDPQLRASLEAAQLEQRRLRPELACGDRRLDSGGSLKCLHAHAAFALARPGYVLGERILEDVGALWPADACCSS